MSRRRKAIKREIFPDPRYGDLLLSKFISSLMYDGRKSVAEKLLYGALDVIEEKTKNKPIEVFKEAIEKVQPQIETQW